MAEGGMMGPEVPRKRTLGRLITVLISLVGLAGCKASSQAEMQARVEEALAAQNKSPEVVNMDPPPYGQAPIGGDAAAGYAQSCRDYEGRVKKLTPELVEKQCGTLIHENNEGSSLPTNHTIWVTPDGVEVFDSAPALYFRVEDNDPATGFSQELRNTFGGEGWVFFADTFPEMNELLEGFYGMNVPTKLTRWDNPNGVNKITTFDGPAAFKSLEIGQ